MVKYVGYSDRPHRERIDSLMKKYPFLEQIIESQSHPLFDINEKKVDDSVLEDKCCDHGSEGPESFSEDFYYVTEGEARTLGLVVDERTGQFVDALTGEMIDYRQWSPPSVRERLKSQDNNYDLLVKTRHLKYEVNGKHNNDISITIYHPAS